MSKKVIFSISFFFLTVAVLMPFAVLSYDAHHDGILLKPALDVANGRVLFKDSFTQYGPMTTYLHVFFIKIFGDGLLSLKIGTVLLYAGAVVCFGLAWSRFLPPVLLVASFILWFLFAYFKTGQRVMLPWSSVGALFFQGLALLCIMRALETVRTKTTTALIFVAGFFSAMVFWCRQPVGVATSILWFVGILFLSWRTKVLPRFACLTFSSGAILCLGIFPLLFLLVGSYSSWWEQNIVWPLRWAEVMSQHGGPRWQQFIHRSFGSPPQNTFIFAGGLSAFFIGYRLIAKKIPKENLRKIALLILIPVVWGCLTYPSYRGDRYWLFAIPLLVTLLGLYLFIASLLRTRSGRQSSSLENPSIAALFFATLLGIASWSQYQPMNDARHVFWGITPSLGPALYLLYLACYRRVIIVFGVLIVFFGIESYQQIQAISQHFRQPWHLVTEPYILKGLYSNLPPDKDPAMPLAFGNYLTQQNPTVPVLNYTNDGIYAALSTLPGPDPYHVFWGWINFPAVMNVSLKTRWDFIEHKKPIIVILANNGQIIKPLQDQLGYKRVCLFRGLKILFLAPTNLAQPDDVGAECQRWQGDKPDA